MRWPWRWYRVEGDSMLPLFREGDAVVVFRWARVRPGRVVMARVEGRTVMKRVDSVSEHGIFLRGDHAEKSTDSRAFGAVHPAQIEGVVIAKIPRRCTPQ